MPNTCREVSPVIAGLRHFEARGDDEVEGGCPHAEDELHRAITEEAICVKPDSPVHERVYFIRASSRRRSPLMRQNFTRPSESPGAIAFSATRHPGQRLPRAGALNESFTHRYSPFIV